MMVGVEDILHRFGRDLFRVGHSEPRAAWEIGIHNNEVILHLDDDVVAVSEILDIAFPEPNARHDLFCRPGFRP